MARLQHCLCAGMSFFFLKWDSLDSSQTCEGLPLRRVRKTTVQGAMNETFHLTDCRNHPVLQNLVNMWFYGVSTLITYP